MAGEENRVTIVIDGSNDAGGAFASATAEAKAFQDAIASSMRADIAAGRASQAAADARSRAWYSVVRAVQAVRDGEQLLARAGQQAADSADRQAGAFSRLFGVLRGMFSGGRGGLPGGAGQAGAGGGVAAFFTSWGGIAAVLAAIASGAAGIIPAIAAAGGALAAFGLLAAPIFKSVTAGFTAITTAANKTARDQAWDAIPKAMRPIERQFISLNQLWRDMSAKLAPDVFKIFNTGLQIANKLLPQMLPFAKVAAGAIETLLKGFDKFASSPGFKQFQQSMLALAGPAITTIGFGLGRIAIAVGRLLEAMANPNGLRILKGLLEGIAMFITGLAIAFQKATPWVIRFYHDIATGFDAVRAFIAKWGPQVYHDIVAWLGEAFNWVMARLKPFRDFWRQHWQEIATIAKAAWTIIAAVIKAAWMIIEPLLKVGLAVLKVIWVTAWTAMKDIVQTVWNVIKAVVVGAVHVVLDVIGAALALLTGHWHQAWSDLVNAASAALRMVVSVVTSILGGLVKTVFGIGKNIVMGLINGITSMAGAVGSAVGSIASKIGGFFGLSPAREGPLSGMGAPFLRGQRFVTDYAAGMRSQAGLAAGAAAALAGGAGGRGGYGAGAGGGIVIEFHAGANHLSQEYFTQLMNGIRVRGGDQRIITRKVVLQ